LGFPRKRVAIQIAKPTKDLLIEPTWISLDSLTAAFEGLPRAGSVRDMTADRSSTIERFFAGMTEYAFSTRLGIADPPLLDYVTSLLTRFVRHDAVFVLRGPSGTRLYEVVDMLTEAQQRVGSAKREIHRHIGDFTLFWTGVYPEALMRLRSQDRKDYLVDYCEQGKRAYRIASTIPAEDHAENDVLERLSHDFEVCVQGLGEVRREWERRDPADPLRKLWLE
jgi:hypothetical protein